MKERLQVILKDTFSVLSVLFRSLIRKPVLLVVVIILVFQLFFSSRSLFVMYNEFQVLNQLEDEKQMLLEKIEQDSILLLQLESDEVLERFAREKYYMKRSNEVLFILK